MATSPLGPLTLPNGVQIGNNESGIFRLDGGHFGVTPGYYSSGGESGPELWTPESPMTHLPSTILNGDYSFLDPSLQQYGGQLRDYYKNVTATENYDPKGFDAFMMKYSPLLIAAIGGAGAAGAFGGAAAGGTAAAGGAAAEEAAMLTGSGVASPGVGGFSGSVLGGGALPYNDAIEGLIDLTNKGLTGEQAVQTLGEINPAWTQTASEFLQNNPGAGGPAASDIAPSLRTLSDFSTNPDFGLTSGGGGTFGPGSPSVTAGAFGGGSSGSWMDMLEKLKKMKNPLSTGLNVFSGLYGLMKSSEMSKLAKTAMQTSNHFGPYRDQYAKQLSDLMANPSSISKTPGYMAGIDAVTRKLASQGYLGSGNMMASLQKYGGDFFNQETARLASLAGAQFQPDSRAQLTGASVSADLASRALASLGFAARDFT